MVALAEVFFWVCNVAAFLMQPIFVWRCWAVFRDREGPRLVRNGARRLVMWACRPLEAAPDAPAAQEESDVDEFVQKLKDSRRVAIARALINVIWAGLCVFWWVTLAGVLVYPTRVTQEDVWAKRIVWFIALAFFSVGAVFPNTFVTIRLLPVWLLTLTLGICFGTLVLLMPKLTNGPVEAQRGGLESLLALWPYSIICAVTFACVCLKFKVLVLSSLCTSMSYFAVLISVDAGCGAATTTTKSGLFQDSLIMWVWQICVFYGMEKILEFSVKKEVEAALGKCEGSAVSALLDLVCDAVVDLDSDLALKKHCDKLAGLLIVREGKSLRGAKFAEFIAPGDDDQSNFRNAVPGTAALGEGGERAEAIAPNMATVRLRDASGHPFRAVMYHLPYRSFDGRLHHLIGLQEASDVAGDRAQGVHNQRPLPPAVLNPSVVEALQGAAAASSQGSGGCEPSSKSSGSDRGSSRRSESSSGTRDAVPWSGALVVLAEESLEVVACDNVLTEELGLDKGVRFADMLGSDGGKLVRRIVRDAEKVQRGELHPHLGDAGVRELILREDSDGAVRRLPCKVLTEYRNTNAPGVQLVKLHLTPASRTKGDWRTRMGPLRSSRHGVAKKASFKWPRAPSEPQVVILAL